MPEAKCHGLQQEEDVALWLGAQLHARSFRVLHLMRGMLCGVSHLALPCLRWLWVEGATPPTTLPLQLQVGMIWNLLHMCFVSTITIFDDRYSFALGSSFVRRPCIVRSF
jgi:hypothetical protein